MRCFSIEAVQSLRFPTFHAAEYTLYIGHTDSDTSVTCYVGNYESSCDSP